MLHEGYHHDTMSGKTYAKVAEGDTMTIMELLDDLKIPYKAEGHEHCRPGWLQINCPFCSLDTDRFRMGINLLHNYCSCWNCGGKSLASVLQGTLGISFREADKLLKGIAKKRKPEAETPIYGTYLEPGDIRELDLLPQHRAYLKDRGYTPNTLQTLWDIEGIGIAPRFSWRLFIPIYQHGKKVSWTTRSLSKDKNKKDKYISAAPFEESFPHKHLLYGEDYCRNTCIVCEGPLDAWKIGPGAVATFGLSYTSQQLERIVKYPTRVICFDNEHNAQKVARQLADRLSVFPGETYNIQLDSKDPGEASQKEIKTIRERFLGD
jgi:DNA primase